MISLSSVGGTTIVSDSLRNCACILDTMAASGFFVVLNCAFDPSFDYAFILFFFAVVSYICVVKLVSYHHIMCRFKSKLHGKCDERKLVLYICLS